MIIARPMPARGPWIATIDGGLWYPHNPSPDDLTIASFEALAYVNRFGGHARDYSVAQHSLLVAMAMAKDGLRPEAVLLGLVHDAHEIFPPGDVPSPIKRQGSRLDKTASALNELEARAMAVVRQFLMHGIVVTADDEAAVKAYDMAALGTEARAFFGYDPTNSDHVAVWGDLPELSTNLSVVDSSPSMTFDAWLVMYDLLIDRL